MAYHAANTSVKFGLKSISIALWDPKSRYGMKNGDISIGLGWHPRYNTATNDIDFWAFVNVSDNESNVYNFELVVRFTFWLKNIQDNTLQHGQFGIAIADDLTLSLIGVYYEVLRGVVFAKCLDKYSKGFVLPDLEPMYIMKSLRIARLSNRDEAIVNKVEQRIQHPDIY